MNIKIIYYSIAITLSLNICASAGPDIEKPYVLRKGLNSCLFIGKVRTNIPMLLQNGTPMLGGAEISMKATIYHFLFSEAPWFDFTQDYAARYSAVPVFATKKMLLEEGIDSAAQVVYLTTLGSIRDYIRMGQDPHSEDISSKSDLIQKLIVENNAIVCPRVVPLVVQQKRWWRAPVDKGPAIVVGETNCDVCDKIPEMYQ